MKKNKSKAKKGMTLIEVIISVALLSILLIPISGSVMSSFKNNKKSEYKQQASYVGQNVLEELKAYDEIILKKEENGKEYFQLLDGEKISQVIKKTGSEEVKDGREFSGSFERTIYGGTSGTENKNGKIYNVEVVIIEDSIFKYSDVNNLNKNNDADFKLNFLENGIKLDSNKDIISINDKEELIIELSNNLNLKVYKKNDKTLIIDSTKVAPINNKFIIYLEKTYTNEINVEIKNNTNKFLDIYLIKQNNGIDKLNLISSNGNVILYEEDEIETNPVGDMYNYTVTVTDDKNNILFKGSSSKNIKIK